jgi:hypothetical protein
MGDTSYRTLDIIKLAIESSCLVLQTSTQVEASELKGVMTTSAQQTINLSLRKLRGIINEEVTANETI